MEKTVLITGANVGIGRVTALALAQQGARVFLACRSQERAAPLVHEIQSLTGRASAAVWLPLDLSDLTSVRQCADRFLQLDLPLHVLINNAGLAGARGQTRQGFEMAFGVNHLGHFLLTQLLLDRVKASAPARVVTVASRAHRRARVPIDWQALTQPTATLTGVQEYAVSKLCNIWFSAELARQLAGTGVSTYSLHPGVVDTEVWRSVPAVLRPLLRLRGMLTPEEGARTSLYCALDAPQDETGHYYANGQRVAPSAIAQDVEQARALWSRSLNWVGGDAALQ